MSENALTVLRETVGRSAEGGAEKMATPGDIVIDWRRDGGWNTLESLLGISSGTAAPVGIMTALQQHAVLACVDVVSRDISKVDVELFERLPGGGKRKVDPEAHWLAGMLALDPNEEHTWAEFWQMATIHLMLVNNIFIAKEMAMNGDVRSLIPVMPGRVEINHDMQTGQKYYAVSRGNVFEAAMLRRFPDYFRDDQMIHVRKRIVDGLNGLPTLAAGSSSIGLAKSINEYQNRLYTNDGQSRVAVEMDAAMKPLPDDAFRRLKSEIRLATKKMMADGEAMLLEPGYKARILAMTAADMKVAEVHDSTINSVARLFGVPPHKIGHIADEKYSNLEVLERTYAHDVLIPIAKAFEDTFARSLMTPQERLRYFIRFNRKQMEIVDYKQRAEVYKIGLQNGAILPDEFREEFGMNPLPNDVGKVRFVQSTMSMLEQDSNDVILPAGAQPAENSEGAGDAPEESADDKKSLRLVKR